jgi:hypothetical protein
MRDVIVAIDGDVIDPGNRPLQEVPAPEHSPDGTSVQGAANGVELYVLSAKWKS